MLNTVGRGKILAALLAIFLALGAVGLATAFSTETAFAVDHHDNNTAPQNNVDLKMGGVESGGAAEGVKNLDTGEDIELMVTVTGPSFKDKVTDPEDPTIVLSEGLSYFDIALTNPNVDALTLDQSTIKVTMQYTGAGGQPVTRDVQLASKVVIGNETARAVFADSELTKEEMYKSPNFTFTIIAHTPSTGSALNQYVTKKPTSYDAWIPISKQTTATVTWATQDDKSDKDYVQTVPYQNQNLNFRVYMPVLDITEANNILTPDTQNAFYTIHRKVVIFNTGLNSKARGLTISDVRTNNTLANVGASVDMNSVKVKISNGDGSGSQNVTTTNTQTNGGVTIKPAADFELHSSKILTVEYDIVMGNINSSGFTMDKLIAALNDNKLNSKVTVSATNAVDSKTVEKQSSLLVPEVSASQTISCTKKLTDQTITDAATMELTTGETAHVVLTINPNTSPDGTLLINPKMSVTIPNLAAIQAAGASITNYKINGQAYTPGTVISDGTNPHADQALGDTVTGVVAKNTIVTFEFDVTAPSASVALNESGIQVNTNFNADNMRAPLTSSAAFTIQIPAARINVSVDDRQPSAKDTVKVTAAGTVTDAAASGMVLVVKDESASGTACKDKFQNLTITSSAGSLSENDYVVYTTDNSVSVWFVRDRLIAKNETITVTYEDNIVDDYSGNGVVENITARFTQNTEELANELGVTREPSVWSNLPNSVSDATDFTVQTPALALDFQITDPVDEEGLPAVINFGDTVTYKATTQQVNPTAKGNDFVFMATIKDILIGAKEVEDEETGEITKEGGKEYTAAELGLSFKDDVKIMSGELDVTDQYEITFDLHNTVLAVALKDPETQRMSNTPIDIIFTMRTDTVVVEHADQLRGVDIGVDSTVSITNLEDIATASTTIKIANAEIKLTKSAEEKEIHHGDAETYTLKVENTFIDPATGKLDPNSQIRGLTVKDTIDESSVAFGYKLDPKSFKVLLVDKSKEEAKEYAAGTYPVGEEGLEAGKYNIAFITGTDYEPGTYTKDDLTPGKYKITFEAPADSSDSSSSSDSSETTDPAVSMSTGTASTDESTPSPEIVTALSSGMTITVPESLEENEIFKITSTVKFTLTPTEPAENTVYGKIVRADETEETLTADGEITLAEGDSLVTEIKFTLAMDTEGEDITDSEDVEIVPTEDLSSFTFTYAKGLPTTHRLVISYKATTDGIDENAYSQTLSNLAMASAKNAKPQVAISNVDYIGKEVEPDPEPGYPGVVETGATAEPIIAPTGDVTLYIIGGVLIAAVAAGGVVLFMRRRNR